jgi:hypothetical protein
MSWKGARTTPALGLPAQRVDGIVTPQGRSRAWQTRSRQIPIAAKHGFALVAETDSLRVAAQIARNGALSVLCANHSSYLDSLALLATLPAGVRFVAMRELLAIIERYARRSETAKVA